MGGAITLVIGLLTTIAFAASRSITLACISGLVTLITLGTWLQMWRFARENARSRLMAGAWLRGEHEPDTPEEEQYRRELRVEVEQSDVLAVPNPVTWINFVAVGILLVLFAWAMFVYW